MGLGNDEVPLPMAQYAANMACADDMSAECDAHEYLADVLISWLILNEFWFLLHAQDASAVASGGHAVYV